MKTIPITQGYSVKVDDEDYERLMEYKWHCHNLGYAYSRVRKLDGSIKYMAMHRFIMNDPEGLVVDHINFDRLDNRKSNLRIVTNRSNILHRKLNKNNKSGHRGVSWHKRDKNWRVTYSSPTGRIYLANFDNLEDAIEARKQGVLKFHDGIGS